MPCIENGGLFIPTSSTYRLGDEVFMLLNLMDEQEKLPVAGRVVWLTPKGAQGKRTAGVGVQFSNQDRGNTQRKIENYLAGWRGGERRTLTREDRVRARVQKRTRVDQPLLASPPVST